MSQRLTVAFLWDMNSAKFCFGSIFLFKFISYSVKFLIDSLGSYLTFRSFFFFFLPICGNGKEAFLCTFFVHKTAKGGNLLIPHMHRQMHSCFYCCCTEFVGFFFLSSLGINGLCSVFCALTV